MSFILRTFAPDIKKAGFINNQHIMRRILLSLLTTILFTTAISAQDFQTYQTGNDRFAIKVQPFLGTYIDKGNHHFEKLGLDNLSGMNLGIEFPSEQQRPWQQYLNNATLGVGLSVIDWQSEYLGKAIAMYPYLLIPTVRTSQFQLNFKLAAGLGVVNETWYTQEDHDPDHYFHDDAMTNNVFGSYLNAYLSAGANFNYSVTRNVALHGEVGYFHMSNGRTCMPNLGANILYGGVGVVTTFNSDVRKEPIQFPELPYKWALNITGAAGAHRAWMEYPLYLISSFHAGAVYSVTNWYGVGAGLDVFYNGAIDKGTGRSLYRQDIEYTTLDKVRAGIALNNEFRFGLVTGIVDWGVYLFNPSRNYYDCDHPIYGYGKRPLFYKNDGPGNDEAFHYIRFGLKTRIWDNLYLQATAKTHLHICEYVEFGVGYQIPFLKKSKRKSGESIVFHHRKGWWTE